MSDFDELINQLRFAPAHDQNDVDMYLELVDARLVASDAQYDGEVEVQVLRMPDVPPGVDPQEWMRFELEADRQDKEFEHWEEQEGRYGDMIHGEYS